MILQILLEREASSYSEWPSLKLKKQFPEITVEQVIKKYQGFEGNVISHLENPNNNHQFEKIIDEYIQLKELGSCFLLYVISEPDKIPLNERKKVNFLGYDIGLCNPETIYSSIFHEVIFGYFEELIEFKNSLNENFLFPDRAIAEKYVKIHDELSAQGKGVEDYFSMTIYEIWKYYDPQ